MWKWWRIRSGRYFQVWGHSRFITLVKILEAARMWPRKIHCMENTEWGDSLWYKKGKVKNIQEKQNENKKTWPKKKQHCYYEKRTTNITC